jgi:hypothetical protein
MYKILTKCNIMKMFIYIYLLQNAILSTVSHTYIHQFTYHSFPHSLLKRDTIERTVSNNSITVGYQGIKISEDERK